MQMVLKRCFSALVLTILGIAPSPAVAGYVLTVTVQDSNGTATFTDTVGTTGNGDQNGVHVTVTNSGTPGLDGSADMAFSYDGVKVIASTAMEQIGPNLASLSLLACVRALPALANDSATVSITVSQDALTLPATSPNVGLVLSGGGINGDNTNLSLAYNGIKSLSYDTAAIGDFAINPSSGAYGTTLWVNSFSLALTDKMTFNQPGQLSMGGFTGTAVVAEPCTLAILISGLPLVAIRRARRRKAAGAH